MVRHRPFYCGFIRRTKVTPDGGTIRPFWKTHSLERRVKRVDFLMGRNRFLGLSVAVAGSDICALNVL